MCSVRLWDARRAHRRRPHQPFATTVSPSTRSAPRISVGDVRYRNTIRLLPGVGVRRAYSCASRTFIETAGSVSSASSSARDRESSSASASSITTSTPAGHEGQELGVGVRRLRGTTPTQQHDLADVAAAQSLQCVVGDIGLRQVVGVHRQDARDVERDVAVSDDHRPLAGKVEGAVGVVGMPVYQATNSVAA